MILVERIIVESQRMIGGAHPIVVRFLSKEEAARVEGLARTAPGAEPPQEPGCGEGGRHRRGRLPTGRRHACHQHQGDRQAEAPRIREQGYRRKRIEIAVE